jgi:N-acetylglucosaminyldiphosphoundecaprenol N-acetyl-beta-D-mannosaminyltransferase
VSKAEAARLVIGRANQATPGAYVCLTNVHTTVEAHRSPPLRAAVDSAFLSVPDGMPLVWILRRRGHRRTEKITGIEYIPSVARAGVGDGVRHFFYGGAPGVAQEAARRLTALVPGVQVVGALTPPFTGISTWPIEDLKEAIRTTKPAILWVGLGAPKQELWMSKMAAEGLDVPVMLGVGAGIDYLGGAKVPAPSVLRHAGLEWLFRLAMEPRRLWRRYLLGNSTFVYLLGRDAVSQQIRVIGAKPRGQGKHR